MNWYKWLENWDMTSLRISAPFLEMEWSPRDPDKEAAWELYIELLTRITTQPLLEEDGEELAALQSVYSLFDLTRSTIKAYGRDCQEFAKIAIIVLNQIVRPFTSKWHRKATDGKFSDGNVCQEFRKELNELQVKLRVYTQMLSEMAGVEDLTELEYHQHND